MKRLVLTFIAAVITVVCHADARQTDSLLLERQKNFSRFAASYPQERVYLHFDNTSYYKGERIWYKAYVVRGDDFRATPLSRVLYVELLNPIGYPVETHKLKITGGQADGSFLLADTLNAGFYEVRAYTAWMLNFTPRRPSRVETSDAARRPQILRSASAELSERQCRSVQPCVSGV